MLLEAKKSWEFIGGMVQLMANKEMVTMKQGLLDFGADFEADLARAAEWIERNIKAINESITLLKQGKKLSGKKRAEAERLGITTATQEGAEEMLRDLEMLKGQFELIGSYPDLIAQAQMWDGKTEVDPVGRYLEQAREEREQAAAEGEMDADEYLAEQARKEAAEAVPSLFGVTMEMGMRKVEGDVTFNVIGPSAANWDKIKHRAFKGRDDGKERVELDSSKAKMKKAPLHRMDDSLVRDIEARLKLFREQLEQHGRWGAVLADWSKGVYKVDTWDEQNYMRQMLRGAGLEFPTLARMGELGVFALGLDGSVASAKKILKAGVMKNVVGYNRLGEVLDFPALFESYPELKKLPVWWMNDNFRMRGAYVISNRDGMNRIMVRANRSEGGKLSTLLHEVQHWIQHKEGFAYGSAPGGAVEFLRRMGNPEADSPKGKQYRRFAGEIESRNVQARRWLAEAEREELPFNETLEYPGEAISYTVEDMMTFNVIGPSAANWGKIKHRAFKGRDDGKERVEIDASESEVDVQALEELATMEEAMPLGKLLHYPSLYEAYPRLKDLAVYARDLGEWVNGYKSAPGDGEHIVINVLRFSNVAQVRNTLLHEVQHGIQDIEGYARGGSVDSARDELNALSRSPLKEYQMKVAESTLLWLNAEKIYKPKLKEYKDALQGGADSAQLERMRKELNDLAMNLNIQYVNTKGYKNYWGASEFELPYLGGTDAVFVEFVDRRLAKMKSRKRAFPGLEKKMKARLQQMQHEFELAEKLDKLSDFEIYLRLAGEIEARNVERRVHGTMEQREGLPFNDSLEYPGEAIVSFSVIGPSAKTWTKYVDRAFAGRDDGKMRAEIDASGARLKWEDLRGRNVAAYRRIVDDWYKLPDEECKVIEAYAELYYDWQDELLKLNSTSEEDAAYFEVYRAVAKLRTELNEKRDGVRKLLGKWFVERGGGAAVMVNADNALVDEIAGSLWGPYMDGKVADELDLQPLRHGGMALQDVLAYDELYEAYPELAQLRVETVKMESARGCVRSSDGQHIIQINKNLEGEWAQFFSTLMHEVQHVIQDIEGFAKGGNPQSARDAAGNYKRRYEIQNECARLRQNIAWLEGYDVARREFLNIGDAISMREDKEKLQDLRDKYNNLAYQYNKGAIAEPGFNGEDGRDSSFVIPMLSGVTKSAYAKAQKAWDKTQDRKTAFPGLLERLRARYDVLWAEFSELDKQQQRWGALSSHELYLRLAGEIEARNVQQRVRMTADERLTTPFNETLEYPGEALVTYNMERVQANWEATLKRFVAMPPVAGTPAYERDINVCPTPAVMQMVGARGLDLVISPHVLVKSLDENIVLGNGLTIREMYGAEDEDQGKHKVLLVDMQKLTVALADPVCISVSDTRGSIEVITELKEDGKNVLVAVRLNTFINLAVINQTFLSSSSA